MTQLGVHSRSSVEIEAAFVLNVKHQVASIEELHNKEEVLLCKQDITVGLRIGHEEYKCGEGHFQITKAVDGYLVLSNE